MERILKNTGATLLLVFSFLIFQAAESHAQNKGIVHAANTEDPLPGVHVYYKYGSNVTVSNTKGEFSLARWPEITDTDTLYFSHIGYLMEKISYSDLKREGMRVYLQEDTQQVGRVTVEAERPPRKPYIEYKTMSRAPVEVSSFGSVLHGDKIYLIGGDMSYTTYPVLSKGTFALSGYTWNGHSGDMYVYDIATDTWTKSRHTFRKRACHDAHLHDGRIYVLGGKNISRNRKRERLEPKIEVYDIPRDTVVTDDVNPHMAVNFASCVYNDNLYVFGGSVKVLSGNKIYSPEVHMHDLKTGYWYRLDDMPNPKEAKGILAGNTFYLVGGYNGGRPLWEVESYNLDTGVWTMEGYLTESLVRPGLAYNDGVIYIYENGIFITYNVDTKEVKQYMTDLSMGACNMHYHDGELYILGGYDSNERGASGTSELYSIDADGSTGSGVSESGSAESYSISTGEFNRTEPYRERTGLSKESPMGF